VLRFEHKTKHQRGKKGPKVLKGLCKKEKHIDKVCGRRRKGISGGEGPRRPSEGDRGVRVLWFAIVEKKREMTNPIRHLLGGKIPKIGGEAPG